MGSYWARFASLGGPCLSLERRLDIFLGFRLALHAIISHLERRLFRLLRAASYLTPLAGAFTAPAPGGSGQTPALYRSRGLLATSGKTGRPQTAPNSLTRGSSPYRDHSRR